ncbi:MAG: Gfo/Idh/MocA family oxidoreductase [Bacteroidales bacterium]
MKHRIINIALIGYGYWGPNVAKNIFESKLTKLYSICDKRPERLDLAKTKYLSQTNYNIDYNDLLKNIEIDAIAIVVETSAHFKIAKEAILAGKNVFLEKPMTSNSSDAEELKELASQNHVKLHVDHIMLFHPAIKKIKSMVESGEIGELIYFDSSRLNLGKIKNDVSAMWDLAVHDLAVIDFLINGISPDQISVMGEKHWSKKESLTFLNLKYGRFIAHLKSSWISPVKERRIIVAGTKKMIVFDDMRSSENLIIYDKGFNSNSKYENIEYEDYAPEVREGNALIPHLQIEDALKNSIEYFANIIVNDNISYSGADQAIRIINILEQADILLKN